MAAFSVCLGLTVLQSSVRLASRFCPLRLVAAALRSTAFCLEEWQGIRELHRGGGGREGNRFCRAVGQGTVLALCAVSKEAGALPGPAAAKLSPREAVGPLPRGQDGRYDHVTATGHAGKWSPWPRALSRMAPAQNLGLPALGLCARERLAAKWSIATRYTSLYFSEGLYGFSFLH